MRNEHATPRPITAPVSADLIVASLLFLLAAVLSWSLATSLDPALYRPFAKDFWFQSDLQRIVSNMLDTGVSHYRTNVHPLYSLVVHPLVWLLGKLWPGSDLEVVHRFHAGVAGLWSVTLYALWRRLGFNIVQAVASSLFACSTAAFVYWYAVPETYGLGSISLILVLLVAARHAQQPASDRQIMWVSAASLSMTITNWMAGLALALVKRPLRQAVRLSVRVLVVVAALSLVQKVFFPTAGLFFLGSPGDAKFINHADGGTPLNKLNALLFHTVVMPEQTVAQAQGAFIWPPLSVQQAVPGSGGAWALPAVLAWSVLLLAGAWGLWRSQRGSDFSKVLGLTLAGQIALHLLYGEESFLYTLHLLPLLLTVAVFAYRTPLGGGFGLALTVAALGFTAAQNVEAFRFTQERVVASLNARDQTLRAMHERPDEVWPRGKGHVVLGDPGGPLAGKGYQEPGGSFSPAPGSFGLSIWVTDPAGHRLASSDDLPLPAIRQQFIAHATGGLPALRAVTPHYTATWERDGSGWALELQPRPDQGNHLWLVVRSVGPAGGPLEQVRTHNGALIVDGKWRIHSDRAAGPARLGRETSEPLALKAAQLVSELHDENGWAFAALPLNPQATARISLQPLVAASAPSYRLPDAWLHPQTPDPDFGPMLLAQQAHLLAGLTDGETRPGEPLNYDFEWSRDGAFIIVALARSGHVEIAEQLLQRYLTQDFFGGFGAEADAPGLAIWAMDHVAALKAGDQLRRQWWPHVLRKTRLIEQCLSATQTIVHAPAGRMMRSAQFDAASSRPCEAARDGLIMGRMDNQYPVPYVNAVSYLGLRTAARWAEGLGLQSDAARLTAGAGLIESAWARFFTQPRQDKLLEAARRIPAGIPSILKDQRAGSKQQLALFKGWVSSRDDVRTYIVGLWPSGIAASDPALRQAYVQQLERRWQASRNADGGFRTLPVYTYFDVAEAHQWLLAGERDRVWRTLNWLVQHSRAPGLYTWWEGFGEENSSNQWEGVRGWVRPDGVSPHYWTAAEVALLQLDMLARVNDADPRRPIVVGSGVPRAWLNQPLDSGWIGTSRGLVRWTWTPGTGLEVKAPAGVTVVPDQVFNP